MAKLDSLLHREEWTQRLRVPKLPTERERGREGEG